MNRHSLFYVPSTPSLCLWEDKAFSGKCSFFDLVWWASHLLTNPALATAGSGVVLCPSTCGYGGRGGPWPRSATSTESGVRGLFPFWLWLCKNGDSKATDIEMWLQRGMRKLLGVMEMFYNLIMEAVCDNSYDCVLKRANLILFYLNKTSTWFKILKFQWLLYIICCLLELCFTMWF